ncbi:hypothetical protein [Deinococcus wulumuqiensis]|uniref:hypothetical protein n=1 Tax=Deinococcus wulumuqiensis TaxID=980427 RepID=UPI00243302AE|nr:hypothetical protein [Deinococcus wulumuqiensis]
MAYVMRNDFAAAAKPEVRAASYQAFFAFLGIFPAIGALMIGLEADKRAVQAEARAAQAEAQVEEARQAALRQAQATIDLAAASNAQTQIIHQRELRETLPVLVIAKTDGEGPSSRFSLVNLSLQNIMIQSAQWSSANTAPQAVGMNPHIRYQLQAFDLTAILAPGEATPLRISHMKRSEPDALGQTTETGLTALEIAVEVLFLHASSGNQLLRQVFHIRFQGWESKKDPTIEAGPVNFA